MGFLHGKNQIEEQDINTARQLKERNLMEKFRPSLGEFAHNLNSFVSDIRMQLGKFYDLSSKMVQESQVLSDNLNDANDTFEGINQRVENFATSMAEKSAEVHALSSSMGEFIEASRQSDANATEVSDSLRQMKSSLVQGQQDFTKVLNLLLSTKDMGIEMAGDISQLTGELSNITAIIEEVRSISNKTNLLSLNASIEAARAGEAGKGFAIVAQEIGKLAVQSGEAVEKIETTLNDFSDKIIHTTSKVTKQMEGLEEESKVADESMKSMAIIEQQSDHAIEIMGSLSKNTAMQRAIGDKVETITDDFVNLLEKVSVLSTDINDDSHTYYAKSQNILALLMETERRTGEMFSAIKTYTASLKLTDQMKTHISEAFHVLKSIEKPWDYLEISHNKESRAHLKNLAFMHSIFEVICIMDQEGTSAVSSIDEEDYILNFGHTDYFKEAIRGKEYTSEPYISTDTGHYTVAVSVPLLKNREIVGVIMADVSLG